MKKIVHSFLQIFKKGNTDATKILMLGAGLALSLILIAKVYFEQTYDNYVSDLDRVYIIHSIIEQNGRSTNFGQTPGAIAPGIKAYSPAVKVATRCTGLSDSDIYLTDNDFKYKVGATILADSSFFEIFNRPIYAGNTKEILQMPSYVMISRSFAKKIEKTYGNVVGISIRLQSLSKVNLTIGGIYEDFPNNSLFKKTDVIISLPTISKYMYDGTNNWLGNDRYESFIKLFNSDMLEDVNISINKMFEENIPTEELSEAGVKLAFVPVQLSTFHSKNIEVKRMCNILSILAIVLLIAAVMNYILITVSAMVHKAKTVAVLKCYGASRCNIFGMFFSDAFVHIIISLLLSVFIILACKEIAEDLIGTTLESLITPGSIIILITICILVFFICGIIPGSIYSKIPVATAFRRYKENSKIWKLTLLFIQFIASSFFITLLIVVMLQYKLVMNIDTGYAYKNLVYINIGGIPDNKKETLKQEISRQLFVEAQTLSSCLPIERASGNNVYLPDDPKSYMNIADMYCVDDGYFKLMEIPIIEGRNFNETNPSSKEVMVSRHFTEMMAKLAGWKDGSVGKNIIVSEHSQGKDETYNICGVYEDYIIGSINSAEERGSVQFYGKTESSWFSKSMNYLLIKMDKISPENIEIINNIVKKVIPEKEIEVHIFSKEIKNLYVDSKRFKDAVTIAGIVVLIITLIGLIGYSQDEINRRRSEIAIRKINGATVSILMKMFLKNILKLALPSAIAGCIAAYYISMNWLEQYSEKIELNWWLFAACGVATIILISTVVTITIYKAANANPVENLKSE